MVFHPLMELCTHYLNSCAIHTQQTAIKSLAHLCAPSELMCPLRTDGENKPCTHSCALSTQTARISLAHTHVPFKHRRREETLHTLMCPLNIDGTKKPCTHSIPNLFHLMFHQHAMCRQFVQCLFQFRCDRGSTFCRQLFTTAVNFVEFRRELCLIQDGC